MFAALGKNGQLINVVPSQGLVFIRMGNNPDNSLVPFTYNNEVWKRLNLVICNQTSTLENALNTEGVTVYPNPFTTSLNLSFDNTILNGKMQIVNQLGQVLTTIPLNGKHFEIPLTDLPKGIYWLHIKSGAGSWVKKVVRA